MHFFNVIVYLFNIFLILLIAATPAVAGAPLPMLDADPDAQAVIDNLDTGEGARLPPFTVTGPPEGLNAYPSFPTHGPGVRDYSNKWVWAPDRERALYSGGNHGVPHKFNDVWEFDLKANAWIMLHAPDSGVQALHTWWGLTYDSKRQRLLWMASRSEWPGLDDEKPPLMSFDPATDAGWTQVPTKPTIRTPPGGAMTYIPGRDTVLWYGNNWNGAGLQALNPETGSWHERLSRNAVYFDNPDAPAREAIINLDTQQDALVAFLDNAVHAYDIAANEWKKLHSDLLPVRVTDAGATADYDPVNGVHMIFVENRLFAYDYGNDRLEELTDKSTPDNGTALGYFDRVHNVFVLYDKSRSVYVYRYGKSGTK